MAAPSVPEQPREEIRLLGASPAASRGGSSRRRRPRAAAAACRRARGHAAVVAVDVAVVVHLAAFAGTAVKYVTCTGNGFVNSTSLL